MTKYFFLSACLGLILTSPSMAQRRGGGETKLPPLKSSPELLAVFRPTVDNTSRSVVRIQVDGKDAALGSVVTPDGFILTKASELKGDKVAVRTRHSKVYEGKIALKDDKHDLALIKVDGKNMTPIEWASKSDALPGNWVASPGMGIDPVAIGVISVAPRKMPGYHGTPRIASGESGFLGISLSPEEGQAVIEKVSPNEAAEKAGLKDGDTILSIEGQEVTDSESVINTLLGYKAGEKIKVLIRREGKEQEILATLGKRPSDLARGPRGGGGSRSDLQNSMGSILSERRTGFPAIMQHDQVIKPTDCGGPLVDLDGRVIGLNICRAGRTESDALPSETIVEVLPKLLGNARKKIEAIEAEEKKVKDHPIEKAPDPRVVTTSTTK
jgi:serine protease Do